MLFSRGFMTSFFKFQALSVCLFACLSVTARVRVGRRSCRAEACRASCDVSFPRHFCQRPRSWWLRGVTPRNARYRSRSAAANTAALRSAAARNGLRTVYRAMHVSAKRGIAIACRLSVRPSVRPSVTLVDQDHIGRISWKLTARTISPTPSLFVAERPPT